MKTIRYTLAIALSISLALGQQAMERREFLAANDSLHSKLHKLLAGALRK